MKSIHFGQLWLIWNDSKCVLLNNHRNLRTYSLYFGWFVKISIRTVRLVAIFHVFKCCLYSVLLLVSITIPEILHSALLWGSWVRHRHRFHLISLQCCECWQSLNFQNDTHVTPYPTLPYSNLTLALASSVHLLLHEHLEKDIGVDTPGHAPVAVPSVAVSPMPPTPGPIQVL